MIETQGGLRVSAILTYPHTSTRPSGEKGTLVAYCSFRLDDGHGFELFVKSARLKVDHYGNFFLSLPSEPRQAKCAQCQRQNADHVNYCAWCGQPQKPAAPKGWFMDVVCPSNAGTRAALLKAAVDEHNRIQAQNEGPRVARGGRR